MGYGGSNPPRRISTMSSENLKAKSHNYKLKAIEGFTLIELLVVIAIISLLSSIVLASLSQAREKAKVARAQQELLELRNAAYLLVDDTGKGPGGCPMGVDTDQEVALDDDQIDADPDFAGGGPYGGLSSVPSVDGSVCNPNAGSSDLCFFDPATRNIPKCKWTADDIVKVCQAWMAVFVIPTLDLVTFVFSIQPPAIFQNVNGRRTILSNGTARTPESEKILGGIVIFTTPITNM